MKLSGKKMIVWIVSFILTFSAVCFILIIVKDRTYFHSPPYIKRPDISSEVLVIYYSRSGNTEAMARQIAQKFNADIVNITTEKYPLDLKGWRNAGKDADQKVTQVSIKPEIVDMEKYNLIFLGSPIWWFRPAPPLWAFVSKNNFKGKNVVLFNTFNSRFKQEEIEEFKELVIKKGGRFIDHVYIRRGRVYYQKSGETLMKEAREVVEEKLNSWKTRF